MEFIRGTTLVFPVIRNWSAEVKAERDIDVKVGADGKILPKNLLDLGRKSIYPRDALDPMLRCRKAVERACLTKGTRFMGGYAIPDEHVDEAIQKIGDIQTSYEGHVAVFMREFEARREAWLNDPEQAPYRDILNNHVPDKLSVSDRFRFSWQVFKLEPVEGHEPDEIEITNQIFHELALDCRGMAKSLLDRKTATTGETLGKRLNPFIERLDALSFGNSRILTVLGEFCALRDSIPPERIDKDHPKFGQTMTFLKMGSDSETLEQIVNGQFSVAGMINSMVRDAQSEIPAQSVTAPVKPAAGAYF